MISSANPTPNGAESCQVSVSIYAVHVISWYVDLAAHRKQQLQAAEISVITAIDAEVSPYKKGVLYPSHISDQEVLLALIAFCILQTTPPYSHF